MNLVSSHNLEVQRWNVSLQRFGLTSGFGSKTQDSSIRGDLESQVSSLLDFKGTNLQTQLSVVHLKTVDTRRRGRAVGRDGGIDYSE